MNAAPISLLTVWYLVSGIPAFLILRRTGLSAWWGLFLIIPIFGAVIVLWLVALRQWPQRARP